MNPIELKDLPSNNGNISKTKSEKKPSSNRTNKFLKGPIPWQWLEIAANLPGKSLHVAIVIWHFSALNKSHTISLSSSLLESMGVKRNAGYRALSELEGAGLVKVDCHAGRLPVVTLLTY